MFLVTDTVGDPVRFSCPGTGTYLPATGGVGCQRPHLPLGQGMHEPPQPEFPKRSCLLHNPWLQRALAFGQNNVCTEICASELTVGSDWDYTFLNALLPLASPLSSLPYRFPPIRYLYKIPFSGSDVREQNQSYYFNQKLRTRVGRQAKDPSQCI